ncbi:hypothetical protein DF3PB_90020 [uncultured Defluviicoccus sp.]|uniref:Uncharacterized protein n=1 Tax=metagenome TaxID=256318 RepID=A0A380TKX0_9ZZZZ|nr:hypothetical protein DF3PB_90020 [uncultured Defluviicoccus sp.]
MRGLRGGSVERPAATVNREVSPPDFRARLYESYASLMQTAAAPETGETLRRAVRAFRCHFRGWLPVDRAPSVLDAVSSVKPN